MIHNPLDRGRTKGIRVNDNYDQQDIVVENSLSKKHQWIDMPNTSQLTQNSWNFSAKTRENNFNDIVIPMQRPIGRIQRYRTPQREEKYRDPLPRQFR